MYKEAMRYFKKAMEVDANCYQAHYTYAYCIAFLGDANNAEKVHKKTLQVKPDDTLVAEALSRLEDTRRITQ